VFAKCGQRTPLPRDYGGAVGVMGADALLKLPCGRMSSSSTIALEGLHQRTRWRFASLSASSPALRQRPVYLVERPRYCRVMQGSHTRAVDAIGVRALRRQSCGYGSAPTSCFNAPRREAAPTGVHTSTPIRNRLATRTQRHPAATRHPLSDAWRSPSRDGKLGHRRAPVAPR
jgi:hypothetical protein